MVVGSVAERLTNIHENFNALKEHVHEDLEASILEIEHPMATSQSLEREGKDIAAGLATEKIDLAHAQYVRRIKKTLCEMEENVLTKQFTLDEMDEVLKEIEKIQQDIDTYGLLLAEQWEKEKHNNQDTLWRVMTPRTLEMSEISLQIARIQFEIQQHEMQVLNLLQDQHLQIQLPGMVPKVVAYLGEKKPVQVQLSDRSLPVSGQFVKDLQRGAYYDQRRVTLENQTQEEVAGKIVRDMEKRGVSDQLIQQATTLFNQTPLNYSLKYVVQPILEQAYQMDIMISYDNAKGDNLYEINFDSEGTPHVSCQWSFIIRDLNEPDQPINTGTFFIKIRDLMNQDLEKVDTQIVLLVDEKIKRQVAV